MLTLSLFLLPFLASAITLSQLSRKELQQLAKAFGIKANIKSEDIIRQYELIAVSNGEMAGEVLKRDEMKSTPLPIVPHPLSLDDKLKLNIMRQVHHYFSVSNLRSDIWMQNELQGNYSNYLSFDKLLTFPRLNRIIANSTNGREIVVEALKNSRRVEFSPDFTAIRPRSHHAVRLKFTGKEVRSYTGPKRWNTKPQEQPQATGMELIPQTLYVKGFPDLVDTEAIKSQFQTFGEVTKVLLSEEPGKAFIVFSSPEHVDRAVASAYPDGMPYRTRTTMAFSLTPNRPFICVMRVCDWLRPVSKRRERLDAYQRAQK